MRGAKRTASALLAGNGLRRVGHGGGGIAGVVAAEPWSPRFARVSTVPWSPLPAVVTLGAEPPLPPSRGRGNQCVDARVSDIGTPQTSFSARRRRPCPATLSSLGRQDEATPSAPRGDSGLARALAAADEPLRDVMARLAARPRARAPTGLAALRDVFRFASRPGWCSSDVAPARSVLAAAAWGAVRAGAEGVNRADGVALLRAAADVPVAFRSPELALAVAHLAAAVAEADEADEIGENKHSDGSLCPPRRRNIAADAVVVAALARTPPGGAPPIVGRGAIKILTSVALTDGGRGALDVLRVAARLGPHHAAGEALMARAGRRLASRARRALALLDRRGADPGRAGTCAFPLGSSCNGGGSCAPTEGAPDASITDLASLPGPVASAATALMSGSKGSLRPDHFDGQVCRRLMEMPVPFAVGALATLRDARWETVRCPARLLMAQATRWCMLWRDGWSSGEVALEPSEHRSAVLSPKSAVRRALRAEAVLSAHAVSWPAARRARHKVLAALDEGIGAARISRGGVRGLYAAWPGLGVPPSVAARVLTPLTAEDAAATPLALIEWLSAAIADDLRAEALRPGIGPSLVPRLATVGPSLGVVATRAAQRGRASGWARGQPRDRRRSRSVTGAEGRAAAELARRVSSALATAAHSLALGSRRGRSGDGKHGGAVCGASGTQSDVEGEQADGERALDAALLLLGAGASPCCETLGLASRLLNRAAVAATTQGYHSFSRAPWDLADHGGDGIYAADPPATPAPPGVVARAARVALLAGGTRPEMREVAVLTLAAGANGFWRRRRAQETVLVACALTGDCQVGCDELRPLSRSTVLLILARLSLRPSFPSVHLAQAAELVLRTVGPPARPVVDPVTSGAGIVAAPDASWWLLPLCVDLLRTGDPTHAAAAASLIAAPALTIGEDKSEGADLAAAWRAEWGRYGLRHGATQGAVSAPSPRDRALAVALEAGVAAAASSGGAGVEVGGATLLDAGGGAWVDPAAAEWLPTWADPSGSADATLPFDRAQATVTSPDGRRAAVEVLGPDDGWGLRDAACGLCMSAEAESGKLSSLRLPAEAWLRLGLREACGWDTILVRLSGSRAGDAAACGAAVAAWARGKMTTCGRGWARSLGRDCAPAPTGDFN